MRLGTARDARSRMPGCLAGVELRYPCVRPHWTCSGERDGPSLPSISFICAVYQPSLHQEAAAFHGRYRGEGRLVRRHAARDCEYRTGVLPDGIRFNGGRQIVVVCCSETLRGRYWISLCRLRKGKDSRSDAGTAARLVSTPATHHCSAALLLRGERRCRTKASPECALLVAGGRAVTSGRAHSSKHRYASECMR